MRCGRVTLLRAPAAGRPARLPGEVSPDPSRPRTPAVRQPATDPPRRSPRRPSPRNPPSCEPPCHCSHPGGRARKTGLFIGPFFLGGAVTASSLRRSPFGLRRSARDPWRQPGTRRVRSRAGRASRSHPRVSPDAALARALPHAAAFGGSAASAATQANDDNDNNADDNDHSNNDNCQIRLGWRHVPPRRASAPGYRRGDLADSPRYRTPRIATGSQRRRSFAAIQRRAPRQLTAPQASSRPDYRAWCCRRGAARLLVSVAERSPAGFPQRHHAGRPATRHPHCASLLRCRCGRPAAVFTSPVWQPRRSALTAATRIATGYHSRRVHAHAIAAPEPACHTALRGDTTRRTCGRPCRTVPVACAWWQPPASGPLRSPPLVCRSGICVGQRTGRRVAGSLRAGCARRRISFPQCGSRRRFASSACHKPTAATHAFPVAAQRGDQARRLGPSPGPSPPAVQSAE